MTKREIPYFAYESREEAESAWRGRFLDEQIEVEDFSHCTRDKFCVGGVDDGEGGIEYMYADGSRDSGKTGQKFTVRLKGVTIQWHADEESSCEVK